MVAISLVAATAFLATLADAHVGAWHPSLFGFDFKEDGGSAYSNSRPVRPIRESYNANYKRWLGNGLTDHPPAPGAFLELKSGNVTTVELGANRAYTSYRRSDDKSELPKFLKAEQPNNNAPHNLQVYGQPIDIKKFGGTAFAIAYTSDVNTVKSTDFTVISVNYLAPWTRLTDYKIPAGMPACPPEGCLCTWNWLHLGYRPVDTPAGGLPHEIYNNLFRCKITGQINNNNKVGPPKRPVDCHTDQSKCVKGPKNPIIVFMGEGNTIERQKDDPLPTYNMRFGFSDGAQNDAISKK